ncbi:MAG: hypothetical protein NVS4B12_22460 [Ktedonobacteraceae bacterium]
METLFVYGLVIIFFVLLIPLIYFLMKDPIARTDSAFVDKKQTTASQKIQPEQTIAYGILVALLTLMCVLTVFTHKTKR